LTLALTSAVERAKTSQTLNSYHRYFFSENSDYRYYSGYPRAIQALKHMSKNKRQHPNISEE